MDVLGSVHAKMEVMGERKVNKSGEDTRTRIIDAALATVRTEGLVGTSARVIARTGGFNQALVFYHFGSIDELLLAALERANERRIERFRPQLDQVQDLPGLVKVAVEMRTDLDNSDFSAVTAIVAGWSATSDFGPRIVEILKPWDDLVAGALRRSFSQTAFAPLVPTDDLAHAVSALFLGLEIMSRLEMDSHRTDGIYASLSGGSAFLAALLQDKTTEPAAETD